MRLGCWRRARPKSSGSPNDGLLGPEGMMGRSGRGCSLLQALPGERVLTNCCNFGSTTLPNNTDTAHGLSIRASRGRYRIILTTLESLRTIHLPTRHIRPTDLHDRYALPGYCAILCRDDHFCFPIRCDMRSLLCMSASPKKTHNWS